jgi:hypothetical protein
MIASIFSGLSYIGNRASQFFRKGKEKISRDTSYDKCVFSESVHLHAILGFSFTPIASAMLLDEVKQVTLYCDDKQRATKFKEKFEKLFRQKRKQIRRIPEVSIITIPELSEDSGGDILSMSKSLFQHLESIGSKVAKEDVIFYSGTPMHIFALIRLFGFTQLMSFNNEPKIEIFGANEVQTIEDFFDLSLGEVLDLHNLSEDICYGKKEMPPNNKKWKATIVKDIFLEGANVVFQYDDSVDFQKGGKRRAFCEYVRNIESYLGGYGVVHRVDNDMLTQWLRNTQSPPPLIDTWGEEE